MSGALQSREDRWQEDEGRKYFILYAENIEYKVKWQGIPQQPEHLGTPQESQERTEPLVDEFENRNRDRLSSLPLKKEITNGKPAPPSQEMDVEGNHSHHRLQGRTTQETPSERGGKEYPSEGGGQGGKGGKGGKEQPDRGTTRNMKRGMGSLAIRCRPRTRTIRTSTCKKTL